jgi:hypothetical protein
MTMRMPEIMIYSLVNKAGIGRRNKVGPDRSRSRQALWQGSDCHSLVIRRLPLPTPMLQDDGPWG